MNRIVARYQDGRVQKGFTSDFLPARELFHLTVEGEKPQQVRVPELKALFFVKSFEGDPQHKRNNDPKQGGVGRRLRIVFKDGEEMVGTTQGYDRSRPGFFVVPVDATGNNERCFVVAAATREVSFVQ
jgi:hypothetical protein